MSRDLTIRNIKKREAPEVLNIFSRYGEIESISMRKEGQVLITFCSYTTVKRVLDDKKAIENSHQLSTRLFDC